MTTDAGGGADRGERVYTAQDVRDLTGLSNRQIAHWENKGLFNAARPEGAWRRYSAQDLFAIMVCSELREEYQLPLDKLRRLMGLILSPDRDCLGEAVQLYYRRHRFHSLLITDLRDRCYVLDESTFGDLISTKDLTTTGGFYPSKSPLPERLTYLVLGVDHITERLVRSLKLPLEVDVEHLKPIVQGRQRPRVAWNDSEARLMEVLRRPGKATVTVHRKDHRMERMEVEEKGTPLQMLAEGGEQLVEILGLGKYEKLEIATKDGGVVYVSRKTAVKFDSRVRTETPSKPQEAPEPRRTRK